MKRDERPTAAFEGAALDALFAPFGHCRALLVAVSGGPDSTALLLLAREWAAKRGGVRVEAATVDHGLRETSAAEAAAVAALASTLGVPHATLAWRGPKPKTRIQERAREARYSLLCAHASAIGAEVVLVAHHRDDQAETVLLRLIRGSGLAGLRGMERVSRRGDMAIGRPLLGLSKAELVALCDSRGVGFGRDPSNDDPKYARARLRAAAPVLAELGLTDASLARLARRSGEAEDALARFAAAALARAAKEDGAIDASRLFAEPLAVAQRAIAARLAEAGGRVELEKVEALTNRLADCAARSRPLSANLGGVLARLDSAGTLRFSAEPPRQARYKSL